MGGVLAPFLPTRIGGDLGREGDDGRQREGGG